MPDYDLSILSNRTFEHLIQALATKVIGPDVMPFGMAPMEVVKRPSMEKSTTRVLRTAGMVTV